MKQKPIEDRFHNARNDQSLVVIEGFHPLKHAIRFGVDLLEIVSPALDELKALQDEYAPDIGTQISEYVNWVSNEVFNRPRRMMERAISSVQAHSSRRMVRSGTTIRGFKTGWQLLLMVETDNEICTISELLAKGFLPAYTLGGSTCNQQNWFVCGIAESVRPDFDAIRLNRFFSHS